MKIRQKLLVLLACLPGFTCSTLSVADEAGGARGEQAGAEAQQVRTVEEVVVRAVREKKAFERAYTSVEGKRFFEGPYGEYAYILAIGQELKNRGEKKRVFTRRIRMPQEYPGSSLDQYDYPLDDDCGINKFKFYDGGADFMALGYIEGEREIIFDVLIGGGPFSAPGIWGPYDQILGKRHRMKIIMGDAAKDGMGMLKSGYAVGMKADLPGYELRGNGRVYNSAVTKAGQCLADKINIEAARRLLSSK